MWKYLERRVTMAEARVNHNQYDAEQCRQMLTRLSGIFAAGMRMEGGQIVEIHILASTDRNPKQIARDVQSALFAAYNIEVDHRIISIAQLPEDPFSVERAETEEAKAALSEERREKELRLSFNGIDFSMKGGACHVSVHLAHEGRVFTGEASCRDTSIQRNRTVAQATVNAVHQFLGMECFTLLEVKEIIVWGMAVMITVIEYANGERVDPLILIGSAVQSDNLSVGIVRSSLDALNRSISKLYHSR